MKAVLQSAYGKPAEVLAVGDVEAPTPGAREVLVRVRAASVHADVWHVVTGFPAVLRLMGGGLVRPKRQTPGTDLAGVVEAVGSGCTRFKVGDAVFGETTLGMQWINGGSFAELACAHEDALALKPPGVSFEQAACAATAGYIALVNLRGGPLPGQQVLVNGAAGSVGTLALQIAKARGATVTGVDSGEKLALVRASGADHVIDYQRERFWEQGKRYDLIFDVASTLDFRACTRALTSEGKYVVIGHDHYGQGTTGRWLGSLPQIFALMARTPFTKHLPKVSFALPPKRAVMEELAKLLADGKLSPAVGRTHRLGEVVQALESLVAGETLGRTVLTLSGL